MTGWATWWVRPSSLILFFIIPFYVLLYYFPQLPLFKAVVVGNIYFDAEMFRYGLWFLIALYLGCMLPIAPKFNTKPISRDEIDLILDIVSMLSIVGYVYMYRSILFSPSALLLALKGGMEGMYALTGDIDRGSAGIASFAQIGLAYFAIFFYNFFQNGWQAVRTRHYLLFAVLVGMTLFRAMFLSQRLALIEIAVPATLFFVRHRASRAGPFELFLIGVFPLLSVFVLIGFFALTEYFRSWLAFYQQQDVKFWDFIFGRMLTYYYTALNNGAILLKTSEWPTFSMMNSFNWLYRLPGISDMLVEMIGPKYYLYNATLELYANPEFNNNSGIFPIIHDWGFPGVLIFVFLMGAWLSYSYTAFVRAAGWGAFYYPLIYLTTVEILRFFYLGTSKLIVQVVLLWMVSLAVREIAANRNRRKARLNAIRPQGAGLPRPLAIPATQISRFKRRLGPRRM